MLIRLKKKTKDGVSWKDLLPGVLFVWPDDHASGVLMRTDKGYVYLGSGMAISLANNNKCEPVASDQVEFGGAQ